MDRRVSRPLLKNGSHPSRELAVIIPNRAYIRSFTIPKNAIDENGHANNVAYVQWMQDITVEHYASLGGIEAQGKDATWVVREHKVEYFLPAFAGEEIEVRMWVDNIRRVRSLRKYEFVRKSDGKILVKGETIGCLWM